jgi:hypothetical protein
VTEQELPAQELCDRDLAACFLRLRAMAAAAHDAKLLRFEAAFGRLSPAQQRIYRLKYLTATLGRL